jgi:uncharacterized Zn finger protein
MGWWRGYHGFPRKSKPRRVAGGIKTKSQRGAIGETWWSRRWIEVLESFDMGARLTRGRSYARQGQVISLDIQVGVVAALVQGSRAKPYSVVIRLKPLSDKDWVNVTDAMAARAIFAAKLLAGEMPQNIEEAFNEAKRSLMPTQKRELETDCSCPDWANPCKHIAAVYYILAERFDEDPFMIFKLRGRTKEHIIEELRAKRSIAEPEKEAEAVSGGSPIRAMEQDLGSSTTPLESCLDTFWQAGPGLGAFVTLPPVPEIDKALLKRLGEAPFHVGGQPINRLLEQAYDAVAAAVLKLTSRDQPDD